MTQYIVNPRRSPRVPARLPVRVAHRGEDWQGETEDVGPRGCLVLSPRPLAPGAHLRLAIESDRVAEKLLVLGGVVWGSGIQRVRAGVAFLGRQPGASDPAQWFSRLLEAQPAMAARVASVPDRVPYDAPLYLLEPPRFIVDFTPAELAVLRDLENGATIRKLLARATTGSDERIRAIFALFDKRALTLSLGQAVPAWRWKSVVAQTAALIAGAATPLPAPPAPRALAPPPQPAPRVRQDAHSPLPPGEGQGEGVHGPRPLLFQPGAPVKPVAPARVGPRPPEAQECFDRALSLLAENQVSASMALLRKALALAPRDPQIAELLGKLAFRDRKV